MPPVTYAPGTKTPFNRVAGTGTPSDYTDAQWKALEGVKQKVPKLKLGAARPEFANKVMLADGTISDDLDAVRAATAKGDDEDRAQLAKFTGLHRDAILADTLSPELAAELRRLRAWANHSQTDELEDSIRQARFLFIVDGNRIARIYFQCAVPGNPDVELAEGETQTITAADVGELTIGEEK